MFVFWRFLFPLPFESEIIKKFILYRAVSIGCVKLWLNPSPPKWICSIVLQTLGKASFSIYLYQQLFFAEIVNIGALVALVAALVAGFTAHHLWDRPLHKIVTSKLLKHWTTKLVIPPTDR
jgi:peptidoglycan/LPS O-acetylase OafA/YrhL